MLILEIPVIAVFYPTPPLNTGRRGNKTRNWVGTTYWMCVHHQCKYWK